jgi:hypothetical protein
MIEPESQVYHAIIIEGIRAYIVTAQWSTKRRRLHVCKESEKETIEDIVQEVKTKKDSRTICPQNVDSEAVRTLITEFMDAGIPIEVDNTFDPLSSLYFLNTLTDNKTFTLSSKCRNTILAMQNSTDIKDISPYLKSLLYIINNIQVQAKNKTEEAALKPFTKQKIEYIKNIEYDLKHKDKEGNVNGFYN